MASDLAFGAGHTDGQALAAELINDAHPERFAVVSAVSDEFIGPDVIGVLRLETHACAVIEPQTPSFSLFGRYFEPLTPSDPLNVKLLVHRPTGTTQ